MCSTDSGAPGLWRIGSFTKEKVEIRINVLRLQVAAKYDSEAEAEVISWFKSILNEDVSPGMREVEKQLRNGQLLVK